MFSTIFFSTQTLDFYQDILNREAGPKWEDVGIPQLDQVWRSQDWSCLKIGLDNKKNLNPSLGLSFER